MIIPWRMGTWVRLIRSTVYGVGGIGLAACGSSGASGAPDGRLADAPMIDAAQPGPGCAALPMTCGPAGNDSCCTSPAVPGGTYYRGYDVATDGEGGAKTAPATVSPFRLDKYEVTVGRFRTFVDAGMGTQLHPPTRGDGAHAQIPGSGWDPAWDTFLTTNPDTFSAALQCDAKFQTWTDRPGPNETRPINCVTWFEAMAFCAWDGGYLPTEAEWNFAAAGGDEQRAYPWSTPPGALAPLDSAHASYSDNVGCTGDGDPVCTLMDLTPVGSKPAGDGRWGQSDLAGNVYEWALDVSSKTYITPCTDCANLNGVSPRTIRGGAFVTVDLGLRTGPSIAAASTKRDIAGGLRCARNP
jgi:sulfatase modifying factor 1